MLLAADRALATQLRASTLVNHDRFVAAHAAALGAGDTPEFRRALNRRTATDRHPRLRRYWHLAGEITGEPAPVGVTHTWLLDALDRSVS